jgi:hypothetical protein
MRPEACLGGTRGAPIRPWGGGKASEGWAEGLTPICPHSTCPAVLLWPTGLPDEHGPPFRPERVSGTGSTLPYGRGYCAQRASADPVGFDGPDMDETG